MRHSKSYIVSIQAGEKQRDFFTKQQIELEKCQSIVIELHQTQTPNAHL